MGIRKIGLLIGDEAYGKALLNGLAHNCHALSFKIIDKIVDRDPFDIILTDDESQRATNWDRTIILASDPKEYNIENMTLFRYQGSKSLINDLLFILSKMDRSPYIKKEEGNCNVIGFYSQEGGVGVTSIALTAAYLLGSKHNYRTLYINIEPVNSSVKYLDIRGIEEDKLFKYAILQGIDFDLGRYFSQGDGFSYLQNGEINEFSIASKDKLESILHKVEKSGQFDYIVLDAGRCYDLTLERLKASCKAVFRVCNDEKLGNNENVIVNRLPIDKYTDIRFPVHMDGEAFAISEDRIAIRHYSIFTSDIGKVVDWVIKDGGENE